MTFSCLYWVDMNGITLVHVSKFKSYILLIVTCVFNLYVQADKKLYKNCTYLKTDTTPNQYPAVRMANKFAIS